MPGGPKRRRPFGGRLIPLKRSGRINGHMIISLIVFFANSSPAMSSQLTLGDVVNISLSMNSIIFLSKPFNFSSSSLSLLGSSLFDVP